jgi:hypothetical protein
MAETELFGTLFVEGRCYEYAQPTRGQGPEPYRFFTNRPFIYLGEFIRRTFHNSPRVSNAPDYVTNFFIDRNHNHETRKIEDRGRMGEVIPAFGYREVPCRANITQEQLETIRSRSHVPTLKSLAFAQLPTHTISEVRKNYDTILGGKTKRNKKSKRKSKTRKSKTRKSKKRAYKK